MPEFHCDTCGKSFSSVAELRQHGEARHPMRAPQGPSVAAAASLECHACGGKFQSEILLREHMTSAHKM